MSIGQAEVQALFRRFTRPLDRYATIPKHRQTAELLAKTLWAAMIGGPEMEQEAWQGLREVAHMEDDLIETAQVLYYEQMLPSISEGELAGLRELYKGKPSSQGGNIVPEMKRSPKFHVGDLVRVKHGVADVDYPDIPMGGWVGRISKLGTGMHLVRWSIETLENVHPVYRNRCERDGIDIEEYWVDGSNLEPAPIGPLNMEQPTAIITRPLSADSLEDRICMVFGLTSDDPLPYDSKATELTYFNYLKTNLTFPFSAQCFDPTKDRKREVTVTGMCYTLPLDEGFGVVCEVLDGGEKGQMPLSELEVEAGNPNFQMVDDYITWFVNAPEAAVDDDEGEDWDEDEDWEDEEDDLEDEPEQGYEEEPLPVRQKVGRNDPCPCGSGKKFKKCCLGKELPQQEKETRSKFPIGTIALYGPDGERTTKIAAAIIVREGADPILERWVGTNVKDNPKVQREIQEFFKMHRVKSVVATDRNMGCPHEEGEDFPVGGDCPFCPWWRGKQGSGAKE